MFKSSHECIISLLRFSLTKQPFFQWSKKPSFLAQDREVFLVSSVLQIPLKLCPVVLREQFLCTIAISINCVQLVCSYSKAYLLAPGITYLIRTFIWEYVLQFVAQQRYLPTSFANPLMLEFTTAIPHFCSLRVHSVLLVLKVDCLFLYFDAK